MLWAGGHSCAKCRSSERLAIRAVTNLQFAGFDFSLELYLPAMAATFNKHAGYSIVLSSKLTTTMSACHLNVAFCNISQVSPVAPPFKSLNAILDWR